MRHLLSKVRPNLVNVIPLRIQSQRKPGTMTVCSDYVVVDVSTQNAIRFNKKAFET